VSRRFFALAIIVAISVLPALYAWVNIYANGNPYANTGEISIAVASLDPGIDLEDGTHINKTEEIFDELKGSDKIGWKFPDTADEAVEGVRSGKYYAAVVFEDNFTYNMYHFEQAMIDDKAPITYYENDKANAIAPKITQTAATNLQQSIKTKYLETVFGIIFGETNEAAGRLSDDDTADEIIAQLEQTRDTLRSYDSAISTFTKNSGKVKSSLSDTSKKLASTRKSARKAVDSAGSDIQTARSSLTVLRTMLEVREKNIEEDRVAVEKILAKLKKAGLTDEEKAALEKEASALTDNMIADIELLMALFPESQSTVLGNIRTTLVNMREDARSMKELISDVKAASPIMETLKKLSQLTLSESVDSVIKTIDTLLDQTEPLAESMSLMLNGIDPVLDGASDTVTALDNSLEKMQLVFRAAADDIDGIIEKVNDASEDDKLDLLVSLLGGDPEKYAEFFSSLVDVEVEEVYSVASYGAAMAPFYSVLAIWVGGVILVSILKTHIDRKKFPDATEAQAFFGRFLLFFIIGQVQAAVIVAGDIYLLGCAPVHPKLMYLCAAVTSLVFILLIYALTISFGDIGKAIVVVVMVLQIAGSSGSYPIEILPVIFSKGYIFFPFPYAINAMREALSGTYGHDVFIYLAELLIFGVVALVIGLLVRKPFIGMNEFVSEKLEETEVL